MSMNTGTTLPAFRNIRDFSSSPMAEASCCILFFRDDYVVLWFLVCLCGVSAAEPVGWYPVVSGHGPALGSGEVNFACCFRTRGR